MTAHLEPNEKLDAALKPKTAGDLPSTLTFEQFAEAFGSKDINEVRMELLHVWCHYQALELMLASEVTNREVIREGIKEMELEDVDPVEAIVRIYADGLVEAAYEAAHIIGRATVTLDLPLEDIVKKVFDDLEWLPSKDLEEAANLKPADFLPPESE